MSVVLVFAGISWQMCFSAGQRAARVSGRASVKSALHIFLRLQQRGFVLQRSHSSLLETCLEEIPSEARALPFSILNSELYFSQT